MKAVLKLYPLSSLAKVFPDQIYGEPFEQGTIFKNEEFAFQVALSLEAVQDKYKKVELQVELDSPLKKDISIRSVGYVPSLLPAYPEDVQDGNYLRTEPGLFPDPLYPLEDRKIEAFSNGYRALWVTVKPEDVEAGTYPVCLRFVNSEENFCEEITIHLEILDTYLPDQKLIYTQWFHTDCIADYYKLVVFSEEHWQWIEKFMETAVNNGVNMILTPIFTPPLDTAPGGERTTVQLVDVKRTGAQWEFGFDRLERWFRLGDRLGVKYYEISHLYTQWGAAHAPKIMAEVDGVEKQVFGWETDAFGQEYTGFLRAFLPALTIFIKQHSLGDRCYFHISDEPSFEHLENYRRNSELLYQYLEGFPIIDAISDYDFYEQGLVRIPIAATSAVDSFIENKVRPLWCYYCCGQGYRLSNHFMAMPSQRNRILGLQLYKFELEGFLHWGYNFYNAQFSLKAINPFQTTDSGGGFPSGDAFAVYPGEEEVIESIGLKVFHEGLQDLRALQLLEERIGKEEVLTLLEKGVEPITFVQYPYDEGYLLHVRERINRWIQKTNPQMK